MMHALGMTEASYGLGASLFFIGYLLFEVTNINGCTLRIPLVHESWHHETTRCLQRERHHAVHNDDAVASPAAGH
ncbi:hypothetical protein ABIE53_004973 [Burkholderia sp. OAS925]|nr:hypothetical protein [Paraburkholderia graminis]